MQWLTNAPKNLLPLSMEKTKFTQALKEWEYRGDTYDLESPDEVCQLCEYVGIRYQFSIVNKHNENELLIGSECIQKFPSIAVLDDNGDALPPIEARKKVNTDKRRLITDAQTRSVLSSLAMLANKEPDRDIASFEQDYKEEGAFTPKQLSLVLWRLKENEVPYNKSYFKLTLKRKKHQQDLLDMQDWQIRKLKGSLSSTQQRWLKKHKPNL
jgi:hypothetical protein